MNKVSLQKLRPLTVSLLLLATTSAFAQKAAEPQFEEIYKLLHENVVGITGEELNQAAVRGLLQELEPRVAVVTNGLTLAVSKTNVAGGQLFDRHFPYVRVTTVSTGLTEQVVEEFNQASGTNRVKGFVLDLRFASGSDFAEAAKLADRFLTTEQPLLNWGSGSASATKKTNAINVPVAVLVNRETVGAAEAIAAILRETKVGLLLGSPTAGEASVYKEFPLQTGQRLRVATAPIKVAGREMPAEPLKPDIEVVVSLEDERIYLQDPYQQVSQSIANVQLSLNTNTPALSETNRTRNRLNEAELVRRKREGLATEEDFVDRPVPRYDSEIRLIRDPALARAVDLLKGLSVIRPNR